MTMRAVAAELLAADQARPAAPDGPPEPAPGQAAPPAGS
jgi:hypothetical protein